MGLPHFEVATGNIDGVNTTFFTSVPYQPQFTAVFLNGQLKRPDFDDGWTEISPVTGRFDLDQAPLVGDVVQVFFVDTSTAPTQEVLALSGLVEEVEDLAGQVIEVGGQLMGTLEVCGG